MGWGGARWIWTVDSGQLTAGCNCQLRIVNCLAMTTQLLSPEAREFTARALLVGQRIDLRALGSTQRLGGGPLAVSVRGGGAAIIFRYGAVVLFDVQPLEQDEFLRQLEPRVQGRTADREIETITVQIDP